MGDIHQQMAWLKSESLFYNLDDYYKNIFKEYNYFFYKSNPDSF